MTINKKNNKKTRRSFIHQASGAMGVVAVASAGWPLIDQMIIHKIPTNNYTMF